MSIDKIRQYYFLFVIQLFLLSFITVNGFAQKVSVIEGVKYDRRKDCTNYFVLPFGSVSIPGKWGKGRYSSTSYQQYFKNKDSISIAIAIGVYNNFEFNEKGDIKGFDFVKAYYEWDSKYLTDRLKLQREIIKEDSVNNFLIWKIYGNNNGLEIDNLFLFGIKNESVFNLKIDTKKWEFDKKVEFLTSLFLNH